MLRCSELLADMAEILGQDSSEHRANARRIREAMQRVLWMKRRGVFAEAKDTRGNELLHPGPELPTIYHTAEFGAADDLQVYQMIEWVRTHLRSECTPHSGKQYWTSNWFPNLRRSYTHTTYDLSFAENMNFAQTNYQAGQVDEAYSLIAATLCGIFNGAVPGGLASGGFEDGRQRGNYEFADSVSMWGRTVYEGLFGITPDWSGDCLTLSPGFPSSWNEASITSPHFSFRWQRRAGLESIEWNAPKQRSVRFRLPIRAESIDCVRIDGERADWRVEPGVGLAWVVVRSRAASHGRLEVEYTPAGHCVDRVVDAERGREFRYDLRGLQINGLADPQGLLSGARINGPALTGIVSGVTEVTASCS